MEVTDNSPEIVITKHAVLEGDFKEPDKARVNELLIQNYGEDRVTAVAMHTFELSGLIKPEAKINEEVEIVKHITATPELSKVEADWQESHIETLKEDLFNLHYIKDTVENAKLFCDENYSNTHNKLEELYDATDIYINIPIMRELAAIRRTNDTYRNDFIKVDRILRVVIAHELKLDIGI